ncbi:MAG: ankyrin repeat domain-containing protein [Planctomycetes bacterium]|nr:ankyrin repeat domain-containing protein [Planctomycetota bacterium]
MPSELQTFEELMHAVALGDMECIDRILDLHPEMADRAGHINEYVHLGIQLTPLHIAAFNFQTQIVLMLIGKGVDIEGHVKDRQKNPSPLCLAWQNQEMLKLLLDHGARPDIFSHAALGFLPAIEHFIEKNPECVHLRNYPGLTPLHVAVYHGHVAIATRFIEAGANVNAKSYQTNSTPLEYVIANPQLRDLLQAHGAEGRLYLRATLYIPVEDLMRAVEFYQNAFECTVLDFGGYTATCSICQQTVILIDGYKFEPASIPLILDTPDLESAIDRALEAGGQLVPEAGRVSPFPSQNIVRILDSEGNVICLRES